MGRLSVVRYVVRCIVRCIRASDWLSDIRRTDDGIPLSVKYDAPVDPAEAASEATDLIPPLPKRECFRFSRTSHLKIQVGHGLAGATVRPHYRPSPALHFSVQKASLSGDLLLQ